MQRRVSIARPPHSPIVQALACSAIASIGLFLRAPDALHSAQFIAEDGTTFFHNQFGHGLPQLIDRVQGYLVVLDRLVAWFASAFPLERIPLVYNVSANLLAAASIAYFCHRARELFHFAAVLAVALLLPMVSGIMLDNVVHLQWFSQFVVVSASLLPRPATNRSSYIWRSLELVAIAITALTGPFALLCLLVYLFLQGLRMAARVVRLRGFRDGLADYLGSLDRGALLITAAAALITALLAGHDEKIPLHYSASMLVDFCYSIAGSGLQVHMLGPVLIAPGLFAGFQLALFVIIAFLPDRPRDRLGCAALLLYGWLCLAAGYAKTTKLGTTIPGFIYGDTYFFALSVFEWLVLWRTIGSVLPGSRNIVTALVVAVVGGYALAYPSWHLRPALPEPRWDEFVPRIAAGETVDVPLYPPRWNLHIEGTAKRVPPNVAAAHPGFSLAPSLPASAHGTDATHADLMFANGFD